MCVNADALDSLDQARSDTEAYRNRFSMQGGQSNLSLDEHKARAKESFARLQVLQPALCQIGLVAGTSLRN